MLATEVLVVVVDVLVVDVDVLVVDVDVVVVVVVVLVVVVVEDARGLAVVVTSATVDTAVVAPGDAPSPAHDVSTMIATTTPRTRTLSTYSGSAATSLADQRGAPCSAIIATAAAPRTVQPAVRHQFERMSRRWTR